MSHAVPVITVDGPSGAGKGTLCRLLAAHYGWHLLDSGSLYRLTALSCLNNHIDLGDESAVAKMAADLEVTFQVQTDSVDILLAGQVVTDAIRQEEVGMAASKVGGNHQARAALLARQRAFAKAPGLVADGRDMGTVVFDRAPVKFFLTASADVRAQRRILQLKKAGITANFEKVKADIEARDYADKNRASAPLVAADDALEVDSSNLSIKAVLNLMIEHADKQLGSHHD